MKRRKTEINTANISFRVPPDVKARLEEKATAVGMSFSEFLRFHMTQLADATPDIDSAIREQAKVSGESYMQSVARVLLEKSREEYARAFRAGLGYALGTMAAGGDQKQ